MPSVRDAYETTAGYAVVRDQSWDVWVLKRDYINDSMSHNEKLEKAIDLFVKGKLEAFERYDDKLHGLLHI